MTREEFIANVRYLGWIGYQLGANLPLHDVDKEYTLSAERLESLTEGTTVILKNPQFTGEDNHRVWVKTKEKQGYKYGTTLDTSKKTHPSMVPYEQLSEIEKQKDDMDILMVKLASNLFDKLNDQQSEV